MKKKLNLLGEKDQRNASFSFLPSISTTSSNAIASQSLMQNEKYNKTFALLQNLSDKVLDSHYSKLKKLKESNFKYNRFDKIIENLEVVSKEVRFPNKRIELVETVPVKGYIEENTYQHFEIYVKDCFSPLKIEINLKKGKIQVFVSFKVPNPDRNSYDRKFDTPNFDIYSPNPVFVDRKCFIGIFAVVGSSIKIKCKFGQVTYKKKIIRRNLDQNVKKDPFGKFFEDVRNNSVLKTEFEEKVKKILDKRKGLVKSLSNGAVSYFKNNCSVEERIKKAREQKSLIDKEKIDSRIALANRQEIRTMTDLEVKKLKAVLWFRKFFEENWITLIYFSSITQNLMTLLKQQRDLKLLIIFRDMQVFKIQQNFKSRFPKDFSLKLRTLAICRNNLMLYSKTAGALFIKDCAQVVLDTIRSSVKFENIQIKVSVFCKSAVIIQQTWRRWKRFNGSLFEFYLGLWNETSELLIAQYTAGIKNKKKKNLAAGQLMSVSSMVRKECILKYIQECKGKMINWIKKGQKVRIVYPRDQEVFKSMILEACNRENPVKSFKKKQTIILNKS